MNNIPERCSNQKELNKLVQVMLILALDDIQKQGVDPLVIETYRPQKRQNYLYCQGRTITECTAKGINKTFAAAYSNPIVGKKTWTLNSLHKSRKAVDLVPQRMVNGKMTAIWCTSDPQTQIIIKIMQKYGFEAGVNWTTTPDSPHFQAKGDFTTAFDASHTTIYVTKAIQMALGIATDGLWGKDTTSAVNAFRQTYGHKQQNGQLGPDALKALLNKLA